MSCSVLWHFLFTDLSCKAIRHRSNSDRKINVKYILFLLFATAPHLLLADDNQWRPLLNESLDGWEVHTGVPHKTVEIDGFPKSESEDCRDGTPYGIGDPHNNFSIREVDGDNVLHVKGEGYAGVSSKESFGNYHLALEYKWGTHKSEPRLNAARDSGVLVHCTGEHGAFWKVWLRSLECQVQENDTGDFIALAGVSGKLLTTDEEESKPLYQKDAQIKRNVGDRTKAWGARRRENFEVDGWNRVDIFAVDDDVAFAVNGNVVMRLDDCKIGGPNDGKPLREGRIQIQCESAEVMYRNIRIRTADSIPSDDTLPNSILEPQEAKKM